MSVLVKHVRDTNRRPFATIAITKSGKVGVALCSPKDNFSKRRGRDIAIGRTRVAYLRPLSSGPNRKVQMMDGSVMMVGEAISREVGVMLERASRYFK